MSQLSSVYFTIESILHDARKKLNRRTETEIVFEELRSEQSGRLLCPFCKYSSPKNKMSAILRDSCFKCFSCGKFGRVE